MTRSLYPSRIVCLTEETTETLYLLGEGDRVVGVSGYTVRPPEAREQAESLGVHQREVRQDRGAEARPGSRLLRSAGRHRRRADPPRLPVFTFNQRSVDEILQMIRIVGGLVGTAERGGGAGRRHGATGSTACARRLARFPRRPRVFFEEWDDPLISGIRWVDELVEIAGGDPHLPRAARCTAGERTASSAPTRWRGATPRSSSHRGAGRRCRRKTIACDPAGQAVTAIRDGHVYEIKSTYILQPGPASLTEGVDQLHQILQSWATEGRAVT